MNGSIQKTNGRGRVRQVLAWLTSDWLWEVCLIVVVAPVVIDSFLSMGTSAIV